MNLDDYRGRLLARAFHDELEKLSFTLGATGASGNVSSTGGTATRTGIPKIQGPQKVKPQQQLKAPSAPKALSGGGGLMV